MPAPTIRERLAEIDRGLDSLSADLTVGAAAENLLKNEFLRKLLDAQRQVCLDKFQELAAGDKYTDGQIYEKLAMKLRAVVELHEEIDVAVKRGKAAQHQVEQLQRQREILCSQQAQFREVA